MKSFVLHCPLCSEHREHCDIENATSMSGWMDPLHNKSTLPTHYSPVGCIKEAAVKHLTTTSKRELNDLSANQNPNTCSITMTCLPIRTQRPVLSQ